MGNAVITVAGKGGVGKTSISAAIVRQLVRDHPDARILAIDADPAVGLATALAVQVSETIDDMWSRTASPSWRWDGLKRPGAIAASIPT